MYMGREELVSVKRVTRRMEVILFPCWGEWMTVVLDYSTFREHISMWVAAKNTWGAKEVPFSQEPCQLIKFLGYICLLLYQEGLLNGVPLLSEHTSSKDGNRNSTFEVPWNAFPFNVSFTNFILEG